MKDISFIHVRKSYICYPWEENRRPLALHSKALPLSYGFTREVLQYSRFPLHQNLRPSQLRNLASWTSLFYYTFLQLPRLFFFRGLWLISIYGGVTVWFQFSQHLEFWIFSRSYFNALRKLWKLAPKKYLCSLLENLV